MTRSASPPLRPADLPPPPPGRTGWPWTAEPPPLPSSPAGGGDWPRVSLVTPSYGQGAYIEATIRSVLLQGYPRLEYLVLDGGSRDGTVDVLQRYAPWLTHWHSAPDAGQADAIRRGWANSSGEYVGWLNADDLLAPGSLGRAAEYLAAHPECSGVYGDILHTDAEGAPIGPETYRAFDLADLVRRAGWISQPGSLFRRAAVEAAGGIDPTLRFLMDLDLWLRLGLVAPLGYLRGAPLAWFRRHAEAKSSAARAVAAAEIVAVYRRFFSRDLPPHLRAIEREALASANLFAARAWSSAGEAGRAVEAIRGAVAHDRRVLLRGALAVALAHVAATALLGARRAARWRAAAERALRRLSAQRHGGE